MNVIDSLFVLLKLDSSQFEKGQKDAQNSLKKTGDEADKQRKAHEAAAKKTAEAYNSVRDSIMGVAAAIVSAVAGGEFLNYLTKNDMAAGNLAKNVGSTAREVSALEGVFRRLGSSTADAEGFLRNTNKILEEIKLTGTSSALLPLVQGGLNVAAFRNAGSMQERMMMLSSAAKNLSPQDAQFRLQAAGYSESTINLLLQSRRALSDVFAEQQKLNVLSQKDIDLAFERQYAWSTLTETLTGFGRKVANEVTPILTGLVNGIQAFLQYIIQDGPTATSVLIAIGGALSVIAGFKIASWAANMTGAFGAIGTAAGTLLGRLGMIGASLASLYEIVHLLSALTDWGSISTRQGIGLTADAQARIKAGALNGADDPFHSKSGAGNFDDLEKKWGLPSGLLDQMWRQESGRGKNMLSPAGAKGHFQFMDATAAQYGLKNPNDLGQSADAAGHYMHDLLAANGGNLSRALAAYNEGQGNLNAGRMPTETQNYVASIMGGMSAAQSSGARSTNVTVQNVEIKTSSSTMTGTGADLGKGVQNYLVAQQANTGIR